MTPRLQYLLDSTIIIDDGIFESLNNSLTRMQMISDNKETENRKEGDRNLGTEEAISDFCHINHTLGRNKENEDFVNKEKCSLDKFYTQLYKNPFEIQ